MATSHWLNVYGCGNSQTAAMGDCMRSLGSDYDFYRENEKLLSPHLQRLWKRLQRFIEPRNS